MKCVQYLENDNLVGVEIGTWGGHNAQWLLSNLGNKVKKLYLVDPYEKASEYAKSKKAELPNNFSLKLWKSMKKVAKEALSAWPDKVEFVYEKSLKAAKSVEDKLDFVYLDGNHGYSYVKQDIKAWYPKLKKGGMLAGHDYSASGVKKAVDEFVKKHDYILHGPSPDWFVIKGNNG